MSRFIKTRSYFKSIKLIKTKNNSQVFKFSQTDIKEVKKSFQSFDPRKATQKDDIKTNLVKKNEDFLRSTYATASMIQFILQNVRTY